MLIDVCEPAEYAAGHAVGARNIPLGTLDGAKSLPSNKALPLVLICASGARANRAAGLLKKAGYARPSAWRAVWRPGVRPACRWKRRPPEPARHRPNARRTSQRSGKGNRRQ